MGVACKDAKINVLKNIIDWPNRSHRTCVEPSTVYQGKDNQMFVRELFTHNLQCRSSVS